MAESTDDKELSGKERSALRARAHGLKPVVWIGEAGATAGALREIDRALDAHELVKIHAAVPGHAARAALLEELCATLGARPVQVIGKMLVAFRPRSDQAIAAAGPSSRGRTGPKPHPPRERRRRR